MRRLLVLILCLLPGLSLAQVPTQVPAQLVADSLAVTADQQLVASGNVEVFYGDVRLSAARITYSSAGDRLSIDGPIFIQTGDGTVLTAERAEIDPGLENGLLLGARLVLDRQLQLAAARVDRIDGRYSALTRTAATSCQVCDGRAPLWEIRAAQVVHDEVEGQLYFEDAQFLIRGVPVIRLPALRLPDPSNDRSNGLLIPRIRTTDRLSLGIKLPYFIELGASRDLTLTPYLSSRTRTLEARYRQAWLSGTLTVEGAVTRDDLRPEDTRGYVFADGDWVLGPGTALELDVRSVSDDAYLRDYGYSELDRLESGLRFTRIRADSRTRADLSFTQTLRQDEAQGSLPPLVLFAETEGRRDLWGGRLDFGSRVEAFQRTTAGTGDAARDVARLGADAGWSRGGLVGPGMIWEGRLGLEAGTYLIADDPAYAQRISRITPSALLSLRWPLSRREASGATSVLEPMLTLAWARTRGPAVPNEDSPIVEFDEANLGLLSRYPGQDARENGIRLAFGVGYTRIAPDGSELGLTFGRIVRREVDDSFDAASGLSGRTSDWLLSARVDLDGGLGLRLRTIFDDRLDLDKTEARVAWANEVLDLSANYVWLPEAPLEGRDSRIAEWSVDGRWQVSDNWAFEAAGSYDLAINRAVSATLGLGWRNECVEVDVSVERRYTSSEALEPVTGFGFEIGLLGFSTGSDGAATPGRCR